MFADVELASKIEGAEARLTREAALGCTSANVTENGFATDFGGGVAAFIRPGSPMNKIIGAGLTELLNEASLSEVENFYRERKEPVRIELATLALAEVGQRLTSRGYRLMGFENVLGRNLENGTQTNDTNVLVERIAENQLEKWRNTVVNGFATPDDTGVVADSFTLEIISSAVSDITHCKGYERYIALRNGETVGAASMRLDGNIALLTGAATLVEHRRNGVQSALLEKRLTDARNQRAEVAVITTAPGTRSQANSMRQGFSLLYSRAILIRQA